MGLRCTIFPLASVAAFFAGGPFWSAYVASKHYVLAFTRGLSRELSGSGVTVTALCPGPVETDFIPRSAVGGIRAYRWLPRTSPAVAARAGYRAVMSGRTIVTPGLANKLFAVLGLISGSLWILLTLFPTLLIVRYYVIAREEAYLTRRFGTAYLDYMARVRRWF